MSNNESAEKIDNASSMIQGIADQTNLLSLNTISKPQELGCW